MSAAAVAPVPESRLLSFEVCGSMYAIPIAGVLEVIEAQQVTCIPTLSKRCAGVMNWHGDALPLVAPELLFDALGDGELCKDSSGELVHGQVLVVSSVAEGGSAGLGLPIDRVLGVVDGAPPPPRPTSLVVERRPLDGRVVSVLDPRLLVLRAAEVIEREVGPAGNPSQGETQ